MQVLTYKGASGSGSLDFSLGVVGSGMIAELFGAYLETWASAV